MDWSVNGLADLRRTVLEDRDALVSHFRLSALD
jgi:hypothetical protein